MLKLWPLLLLVGCLQQGLVANPDKVNQEGLNTGGTTTGGTETTELRIRTERGNVPFLFTKFGSQQYDSNRPIQGYDGGNTFCLSNESSRTASLLDTQVTCRRPSTLSGTLRQSTGRTSTLGLPFIIQGLQFYFANSPTAPSDKYYSSINLNTLSITLKTAPLRFNEQNGYFHWDVDNEDSYTYSPKSTAPPCELADDDAVGFDILNEENGISTDPEVRSRYFVTGIWVFERSQTRPYENVTSHTSPIGDYGGYTSGPSTLFSTRTNVFGSLLLPHRNEETQELGFQYFPGNEPGVSANYPSSTHPKPYKYTFGRYRTSSPIQTTLNSVANEEYRKRIESLTGALITSVMGKYPTSQDNTDVNSISEITDWDKRVITGLCIKGSRSTYAGATTPAYTHPIIHALKYELRKIQVVGD